MADDRYLPGTILDRGTGRVLRRDVRPFVVSYGGQSITVDLPGYYPDGEGDGVVIGDDMRGADEHLLKAQIATTLQDLVTERKLTQTAAAEHGNQPA